MSGQLEKRRQSHETDRPVAEAIYVEGIKVYCTRARNGRRAMGTFEGGTMRRKLFVLAVVVALAIPAFGQLTAPGADNSPKVGDTAPDFAIPGPGRGAPSTSLKDFQGKKNVLLMFF